jgi:hypothetical protein
MRPSTLSAADHWATANIGEHHRIRATTGKAIDDNAAGRHIDHASTAQAVAAGDIHGLPRIAAPAAVEARPRVIIVRWWRPMATGADIDVQALGRRVSTMPDSAVTAMAAATANFASSFFILSSME